MKSFLKNRTVIGICCIALAFVLCFGITPLINRSMGKQTEIMRATQKIKKGEEITKEKVKRIKVGAYNLPKDLVKDPIGSYAKVDIYEDDYFLKSKISDEKTPEDAYLYDMHERMAVSITIKDFAAGLSGKLLKGDIVSIISGGKEKDENTKIVPELQFVELLALTAKTGLDQEKKPDVESGEEFYATATLLVTPVQAEKLIACEQTGEIHIGLVYRGGEETKNYLLEMQDKNIDEMEKEGENIDGAETGSIENVDAQESEEWAEEEQEE